MAEAELAGKVVERVDYDYNEALRVFFTDGSMLYVSGVWHNDSTAGTKVAVLAPDQPKSFEESGSFYGLVRDQAWA